MNRLNYSEFAEDIKSRRVNLSRLFYLLMEVGVLTKDEVYQCLSSKDSEHDKWVTFK